MAISFWAVAGAALAARLLFLAVYAQAFPEYWNHSNFGGWEMGKIAVNLYEGRGFSSPFSMDSQPTAWVSPLIPAMWAGVMKLMREATSRTEIAITVLHAAASSLAAAFYVAILQRLVPNLRRAILLSFAAAMVLWPESLLRIVILWYYPWQELSVAVLVWLGILWSEQRTTRAAIALGIAGGISALINVSPIPLFALALVLPVLATRSAPVLRRAFLGAALALLLVTPWLIRHRVVFGTFVPLRGNIGVELLQGNNPDGAVRQRAHSLHPYHTPAEFERYRSLGELAYGREAGRRALDWVRQNPGAAAVKVVQRFYVVWITDLTDTWSWDSRKWWEIRYSILLQGVTILSALVPLALAIIGLMRVGFRAIPHRWLLAGTFLVPFPHYFTQVEDSYVAFLRPWLLLIATICFVKMTPKKELATGKHLP